MVERGRCVAALPCAAWRLQSRAWFTERRAHVAGHCLLRTHGAVPARIRLSPTQRWMAIVGALALGRRCHFINPNSYALVALTRGTHADNAGVGRQIRSLGPTCARARSSAVMVELCLCCGRDDVWISPGGEQACRSAMRRLMASFAAAGQACSVAGVAEIASAMGVGAEDVASWSLAPCGTHGRVCWGGCLTHGM